MTMCAVTGETIGQVWLGSMARVMAEGREAWDEDVRLRELLGLTVCVMHPALEDPIVNRFGDAQVLEHTLRKFEKGTVMANRPFTYGDCIYNKNGVDQFEWMVERLTKKRESKSATISLLTEGSQSANLPCLSMLDAKIRNDRLHVQFFFRSQNIVGRQYANLMAIATLQHRLAARLGVAPGMMAGYVASAHIYQYDLEYAEAIGLNKRVVIEDHFYDYGPRSIRLNPSFK